MLAMLGLWIVVACLWFVKACFCHLCILDRLGLDLYVSMIYFCWTRVQFVYICGHVDAHGCTAWLVHCCCLSVV